AILFILPGVGVFLFLYGAANERQHLIGFSFLSFALFFGYLSIDRRKRSDSGESLNLKQPRELSRERSGRRGIFFRMPKYPLTINRNHFREGAKHEANQLTKFALPILLFALVGYVELSAIGFIALPMLGMCGLVAVCLCVGLFIDWVKIRRVENARDEA